MEKTKILFEKYNNFPKQGVNFIDLTPSLLDVKLRNAMVEKLAHMYDIAQADYIISPDARGFIWGMAVAQSYGIGFIPVRKAGKLPYEAVSDTFNYDTEYSTTALCLPKVSLKGKKLLFIDDVYATGGTFKAIKEMVSHANGILLGGAVIIDIGIHENNEIKSITLAKDL